MFQKIANASKISGSSKLKEKEFFAQDLWHAVIAKIPESILVRALHLFSMT
jgi:hypothetical protein